MKDVAAMLKKGRNVIGLMLGGHWDLDEKLHAKDVYSQAFYRGQCMGICQLDLEMEDGSRTVVGSDASWQVSRSPITFSSVFDGEHYDARLEQPGWCTAEFDASGWGRASVCSPGTETLRYSYIPPIRVTEEISVKTVCEKTGIISWISDRTLRAGSGCGQRKNRAGKSVSGMGKLCMRMVP